MAHFIVTFRIANEGNDQERYRSFVDAVVNLAGGSTGKVWDETTSFYAFQADYPNADSVAAKLNLDSKFDTTQDIMVVIDVANQNKATRGPLKYATLLTSYLGF